jgi:hypothetical protein
MEEQPLTPAGFDLALLRRGEITGVIAAMVILLSLFVVPWYSASNVQLERHVGPGGTAPAEFGAWAGAGTLGALANVVVLFAALAAIGLAIAGARGIELDGSGGRLVVVSTAATVAVLARVAFRPEAISGYSFDAGLTFGIFLTLVGTLALIWAAAMRAQRVVPARPTDTDRASGEPGRSPAAGSRSSPRRSG